MNIMIPSPNHSSRNGKKVIRVVIHTAEGSTSAVSLGHYFANPVMAVSSHVGIDTYQVVDYVDYGRGAWTMGSANHTSDQAEVCGFAAWERHEWLSDKPIQGRVYNHQTRQMEPRGIVSSPRKMLDLAAQWIRQRCMARGIPIRTLSPAQVAAGQSGVCGHVDWTRGVGEGTHTDPGDGFPWDYVISQAIGKENMPTPNDIAKAVLDHPLDESGTVTLSGVIQALGLDPHVSTAKMTLDHPLDESGTVTLSGVIQSIAAGTATVQVNVTMTPADLDTLADKIAQRISVTGTIHVTGKPEV